MRNEITIGITFAVSCRRTGNHNYTSADVQRLVGHAVLDAFKEYNLIVNLSKPNLTISVEILNESTYVYTKVYNGAGGMPYGSQGKMVALVDGSTRSIIASWLMMRRGVITIPLYTGLTTQEIQPPREVLRLLIALADWSPSRATKCYTIFPEPKNALNILERLLEEQELQSAFVYADALCELEGAEGIVLYEHPHHKPSYLDHQSPLMESYRCLRPVYFPLLGIEEADVKVLIEKIGIETPIEA